MPTPNQGAGSTTSYALRLFRVKPDTSWRLRMLSDFYDGILTHYGPSGSVWCNPDGCLSPRHKLGPIWKGYCTAELYDEANRWWAPVCFEITETCELSFRGVYRRGQIWLVERAAVMDKERPPVQARYLGDTPADELPEDIDYVPVLRSVYHAFGLKLGVKNPLPARVMVQPSIGAAPPDLMPKAIANPGEWRNDEVEKARLLELQRKAGLGRKTGT